MKSILKKTMAYFLTFAMLIALVPLTTMPTFAEDEQTAALLGTGTEADPILIGTLADLEAFRDSVNGGESYADKYIKLTADIDMSEKYGEGKKSWTPIGHWFSDYDTSTWFNGTFEGNGHKITGLYIKGEADNQGLFGAVYTSAAIRNLTVSGSVTGRKRVGILAGWDFGIIENITVYGSANGGYYVGGIVGYNDAIDGSRGDIKQCTNFANVSGDSRAGGIAGQATNAIIKECRNMGTISAIDDYAGGIVGNGGNDCEIQNCYNTAPVSTGNNTAGGIAGDGDEIQNCYNIGSVTGKKYVGGIVGLEGNVENCYHTTDADNGIGTVVSEAQLADQNSFTDWDFTNVWDMDIFLERPILRGASESASGTENDPYTIGSLTALEKFRDSVNGGETYEGKHIKLAADIDLSEKYGADINGQEVNWMPIGDYNSGKTFSGSFDGDGHKITGLYIKAGNNKALFGHIGNSGTVKNLAVSGEVTQSSVSAIVVADNDGTIKNVSAAGSVSGAQYVGGICGMSYGAIENCSNAAGVNSDAENAGGICGGNNGSIKNCYNTGSVTGKNCVGGICGKNSRYRVTTIQNCYNAAPVTASNETAGGICGSNDAYVNNCYNVGEVTATNNIAGGICGYNNGGISNCYNYANVESNGKKAGICASIYPPNPPENNYYNGDTFDGTNYNRDDGSGEPVYTGKLSESEFADQTKFSSFDFENTWLMDKKAGRPMLKGMEEPSGSEYNPVKIRNLADLEEFRDSVNGGNDYAGKKVLLMADIDMSEKYGADINGQEVGWTPIGDEKNSTGTYIDQMFSGIFDGGGHKISGLYIIDDYKGGKGLFGNVGSGGTIKNLTVAGRVVASSSQSIGLAVGFNNGMVENVHADGYVKGQSQVGLVVGQNSGNISRCTANGEFSGNNDATSAGGVCGSNNKIGKIEYCRNDALYVIAPKNGDKTTAAGICGSNKSGTISYCYNTAELSGKNTAGICGDNFGAISNCYNIAALSAENTVSGICKYNSGTIENCYQYSTLAGKTVSPILSTNSNGTVKNSYYNSEAFSGDYVGTAISAAEFADSTKFVNWDFTEIWRMNPLLGRPVLRSNTEGESGTESDPYIIDSIEKLENFRSSVNNGTSFEGEFVKLAADIDLSAKYNANNQWTPIGIKGTSGNPDKPFSGTFDGNGHKISGLYIYDTSKSYQGLFGSVSGGTIKKLAVTDAQVVANRYFAGIAAYMTGGTIENCYYSGKLGANDGVYGYYGAIAGEIENESTLKNCYANAQIPDYSPYDSWSGGVIAGTVYYSQVTSCYFNSTGNENRIAVGRSPQSTVDSYTGGKTAAELAEQSTYNGWDFENIWTMHPILGLPTFAGGGFSGDGTEQNPYIISTLEDLEIMASAVNLGNNFEKIYFALGADIDMGGKYSAETGISWTPIGNSNYNAFSGVIDGRNHKITGLYIKNREEGYTGLFSYVADGGCIKNLAVSKVTIENSNGYGYIGALAGSINTGTLIKNCGVSEVNISAPESYVVGGLVGYNYGTIKNSYVSGNISAKGTVGGLVGSNSYGTIQNCYSLGSVTGEENVGGLVGYYEGETVVNSYSLANVTGGKPLFGGGWGNVKNCYYTGNTADTFSESVSKTKAQFESGEVAYLLSKGCTVSDDWSSTTYDGNAWKQTIGKDKSPNFTGKTVFCTAGCPSYNNEGNTAEKAHTPNAEGICTACGKYEGAKLVDGAYQINNKLDLIWFAEYVNGGATTANATVTNNIYLNDKVFDADGKLLDGLESFTPIGTADNPYSGTFDGKNHIIGGIHINNSDLEYAGLFGVTAESTVVKNVYVQESYVGANKYVGILVGQNNGTVERCMVDGTAEKLGYSSSAGDFIGGVCGDNNGKIIGDVYLPIFQGKLIGGGRYMGGVCGRNMGSVTNALNHGTIDTSGTQVGGIAGVNDCTDDKEAVITGSANYGIVYGDNTVGGICGQNYAIIKDCTNADELFTAFVTAKNYAGGICGKNDGSISRCVNNEKASISSDETYSWYCYAGGIAAANGEEDSSSISDCINLSLQISGKTVGGIVGLNGLNGNMQYCINIAESGGIVGERASDESAVVNCYYMKSTETYEYGTAATAEEFANGEILNNLQKDRTEKIWVQNIGTDLFPKLGSSEGVSYSVEANGNDVVFRAPKGTYTAVFAAYDGNRALIKTVAENLIIDDSGNKSLSLSDYLDVTYASAKVFFWDSLESMIPMCEAVEIINDVSYSVETNGNDVVFRAPKGTYTAVFAAYDGNRALIKTVAENLIIDDSGNKSLSLNDYLDVTYASAKVFLWKSLESMMPMCKKAEI